MRNVEGIFLPDKTQRRRITTYIKQQTCAAYDLNAMNCDRLSHLPNCLISVPELQSWLQETVSDNSSLNIRLHK